MLSCKLSGIDFAIINPGKMQCAINGHSKGHEQITYVLAIVLC